MKVLITALQAIAAVSGAWLTVMMLYQLFLSMFGFGRKVKDYADHDPESRFLVLVPAHNEEKVISDIMVKLGISPDQQIDEDEASIIESTPMGVWIRRWEDKRPLPEEDEDMKDSNGVIRYIHTWFFGHIGKMLGLKSPYTKMYEDEINRFRVERPDLADVDDDDIINDEFGEGDGVDDE